jgi:trk system potassium uptake protein TrkA
LADDGHEVVVIDKNPEAFRRLGDSFNGRSLTGIVFDQVTLEEAGVRKAQAFVAVTSGDNSNIVSARTAKERYGVRRVVARIYDPERAVIYERLGITTIASARWTAEAAMRELLPEGDRIEGSVGPGGGDVVLLNVEVPEGVHGAPAKRVEKPGANIVVAVTRDGRTHLLVPNALIEGGDVLHLAVQRDRIDEARQSVAALASEAH